METMPSCLLSLAADAISFFFFFWFMVLQNVRLAKAALRPGAGNMVNAILRKLVLLKVLYFCSRKE